MRLLDAARRFDKTTATDAYSATTFKCQFEVLAYSKIDGVAVKKRQISTASSVTIPARRVVTIHGQTYLVGHGAPDFWNDDTIRLNYVVQGADGLANLTTIADELAGTAPGTAYAALAFAKYLPDAEDSSKYPPQYQVFLSGTESAPADSLIYLNSVWYLVKESYVSTSGLRVSLANVVDSPNFEMATFTSRVYAPLTDTYVDTPSAIKVFRIKWAEHFEYLSKATEQYERGDLTVMMLKAVTPDRPDTLTLSDGVWRILSAQDEGLTWNCHARRA
ncbi:MAG TPA: hypothetical protein PLJ74_12880 [Myxococcota bacterium]|nr:hypothetical protein [Myxococcota bacterium]